MPSPRVLILRAPGTNCDVETAYAFELAGASAERVHVNRVLERPAMLDGCEIVCLPGGFSYGDDIAAGRIFALQLVHHLGDALRGFVDAGKLLLGICNGFQVLVKAGLLPGKWRRGRVSEWAGGRVVTLAWNDSGRFEDRWVHLAVRAGGCVFLQGIEQMELPVAHAEGKLVFASVDGLAELEAAGQVPIRYTVGSDRLQAVSRPAEAGHYEPAQPNRLAPRRRGPREGEPAAPSAVSYPWNPNGSMGDAAGLCEVTGRIFGLMPHPERYVQPTQHPHWTRCPKERTPDGLRVFRNAVAYYG